MKILGYLLVLALFGGNNNKYSNFSIEVQKVRELVKNLFKYDETTNEPVFTEEDLRRGNLINKGTVAKYYSKAIRDYIIYRNVSSSEEGFVLTFRNFNASPPAHTENKNAEKKEKIPTVIFIPKEGVNVNDVNNKDLRTAIAQYIDTVQEKINSHEIGVVPTKSDLLEVDVENNHVSINPTKQRDAEVPKELTKSRVYNPNELKEDETKKTNGHVAEKNKEKSNLHDKIDVRDNDVTILPPDKFKKLSVDKNNETKNSEEHLNRLLHESNTGINPKIDAIYYKNIINESTLEFNTDNANISSRFIYENTPTINQLNDNRTSDLLSNDYDKTVEMKNENLKIIDGKFVDKINTAEENNGISDLLNKDDSLVTDAKQKINETLPKANKTIANQTYNIVEEKEIIHKMPKVIEKPDDYSKYLDKNITHNELISTIAIHDYKNKTENKTTIKEKNHDDFKLDTSKLETSNSTFLLINEGKPASSTKFNVDNFEKKTNTGDRKQELPEDDNSIKLNDCKVHKSYEKESRSPPNNLIKLDEPEVNRKQAFQVSNFTEKYLNKVDTESKVNSEIETIPDLDKDDDNDRLNNFTKGPSSDRMKIGKLESDNNSKSKSENNQIEKEENSTLDSEDIKDTIETETQHSQDSSKTSDKARTEWNNEKDLNSEEQNNSEDAEEREPFLEVLNLDEIERAQEQGFAIELPESYDDTPSRSSSEEDDWDVVDDYDE